MNNLCEDLSSTLTVIYGGPIVAYSPTEVVLIGVVTDENGTPSDIRPVITVNNQRVTYYSNPVGSFSHTIRTGVAYELSVISPTGYTCRTTEVLTLQFEIQCSEVQERVSTNGYHFSTFYWIVINFVGPPKKLQ